MLRREPYASDIHRLLIFCHLCCWLQFSVCWWWLFYDGHNVEARSLLGYHTKWNDGDLVEWILW